jgi:hypothetical protein
VLETDEGDTLHPAFQFHDGRVVDRLSDVLAVLQTVRYRKPPVPSSDFVRDSSRMCLAMPHAPRGPGAPDVMRADYDGRDRAPHYAPPQCGEASGGRQHTQGDARLLVPLHRRNVRRPRRVREESPSSPTEWRSGAQPPNPRSTLARSIYLTPGVQDAPRRGQ